MDTDRRYLLLAARIIADFGAGIALPVVLLAWLGRQYDVLHGTAPVATVAGFAVAAVASGTYIYRRAKTYGREYAEIGRDEDAKRRQL